MARIRYLKPDFFKDEDLAELPFEVRLFFAGLWNFADKAGRLEDRPLRLKAEIFPYDNVDIKKCLDLLSKIKNGSNRPFIQRYEADHEKYIQIVNWEKHQKPHHTEQESKIPPPPPLNTMGMEKGMEKQLKGSKRLRNGETTVKKPLHLSDQDFILSLKTNPAYKHLDIDRELGKMDAWLSAHPGRQKTRRFIVGWLNKADKPIGTQQSTPTLTDTATEKALGKIATKDMIKKFLRETPQPLWGRVASFLRTRYPGSGDKPFSEAEREVISEARKAQEDLSKLGSEIGNPKGTV